MSFLRKSDLVIWPKNHSVEIYINQKDNNHFVFEFDLYQPLIDADIKSLHSFFKSLSTNNIYWIIGDDIVITRSFIYESSIENINKDEISAMMTNNVDFDIDKDLLTYKLEQNKDKTIIRVNLVDGKKIDILKNNINRLGLKVSDYRLLSCLITNTVSQFYQDTYSIIYPLDTPQYLFILSQATKIYLTDIIKGVSLDIKKKINYSELYFDQICNKLFIPSDFTAELKISDKIEKNPFDESKISNKFTQSSNFPLPVISFFNKDIYSQIQKTTDIINIPQLENVSNKPIKMIEEKKSKNSILIFVVFTISLLVVSGIIWAILNKPKEGVVSPSGDNPPIEDISPVVEPTDIPTPNPVAELDKDLKIRVLNATDINGQAATVKTSLTSLDFTDIAVGNSSETLSRNVVRYKAELDSVPNYMKQNLPGFADALYEAILEDTDTYDIVILIGQDLSQSTAPSSLSPTAVPTEEQALE